MTLITPDAWGFIKERHACTPYHAADQHMPCAAVQKQPDGPVDVCTTGDALSNGS